VGALRRGILRERSMIPAKISPGENVDLGLQKPSKLLSYKFDKAGSYRVRCNIHPSVKMSVTVN
jgi:plastocyanin